MRCFGPFKAKQSQFTFVFKGHRCGYFCLFFFGWRTFLNKHQATDVFLFTVARTEQRRQGSIRGEGEETGGGERGEASGGGASLQRLAVHVPALRYVTVQLFSDSLWLPSPHRAYLGIKGLSAYLDITLRSSYTPWQLHTLQSTSSHCSSPTPCRIVMLVHWAFLGVKLRFETPSPHLREVNSLSWAVMSSFCLSRFEQGHPWWTGPCPQGCPVGQAPRAASTSLHSKVQSYTTA